MAKRQTTTNFEWSLDPAEKLGQLFAARDLVEKMIGEAVADAYDNQRIGWTAISKTSGVANSTIRNAYRRHHGIVPSWVAKNATTNTQAFAKSVQAAGKPKAKTATPKAPKAKAAAATKPTRRVAARVGK